MRPDDIPLLAMLRDSMGYHNARQRTIANNVASNALRTLSRRKEVTITSKSATESGAQPLDHMAMEASGFMPTRQFDRAERAEIVQAAIESLNERQRMALLLCKFEGMSYAEIADAMALSTPAVFFESS